MTDQFKAIMINHQGGVYRCTAENCSMSFMTEEALISHCAQFHTANSCKECQVVFSSREDVVNHYQNIHDQIRCYFCDEQFDSLSHLQIHQQEEHGCCFECHDQYPSYHDHRVMKHFRCWTCMKECGDENNLHEVGCDCRSSKLRETASQRSCRQANRMLWLLQNIPIRFSNVLSSRKWKMSLRRCKKNH